MKRASSKKFNNVNLDQAVRRRFGKAAGRAIKNFFRNAGLPVPQGSNCRYEEDTTSEFWATYGGGYVTFLNDYGCVFRITNNEKYPLIQHKRILQPIASRQNGNIRLEIYPGITSLDDTRDKNHTGIKALIKELERQCYDPWDCTPRNCGVLPVTEEKKGTKSAILKALNFLLPVCLRKELAYTVVLDADAVNALKQSVQSTCEELDNSIQGTLFKPLRDCFSAAWPETQAKPDHRKMAAFWQTCREMTEKKILVAGWLDSKDAKKYSSNYAHRLRSKERTSSPALPPVPQ